VAPGQCRCRSPQRLRLEARLIVYVSVTFMDPMTPSVSGQSGPIGSVHRQTANLRARRPAAGRQRCDCVLGGRRGSSPPAPNAPTAACRSADRDGELLLAEGVQIVGDADSEGEPGEQSSRSFVTERTPQFDGTQCA
jgi:hypothetical protein